MTCMKEYIPDRSGEYVVLSREQVRQFDSWAINEAGVPGVVLMENAGRSCAEFVLGELWDSQGSGVCIFCGLGNNGGDGYVIARHLANAGVDAMVVICGERGKVKGDALINLEIIERMDLSIEQVDPAAGGIAERVRSAAEGKALVVDALFGTGLSGALRGGYETVVESINACGTGVISVDIPSGLDCDTGEPTGESDHTIRAMATVTFAAVKKGFVANPGSSIYTGRLFVASIGIEPAAGGY